ncbi:hypothetical protein RHGRI_035830 [Rhododendron griersonianum]|uniref:Fe2OG dioxygenase domain-containing protein n=1 Tax=Rhododendron griersonianum TaxID=479676 RepID=A0AAV6HNL7_9ERIC|nr:hypothetical protein RHGRI_035830 [Rhododendron griersonianum]
MAQVMPNQSAFSDKAKEAVAFDQTKTGVKGLIDAGVDTIPALFVQPPEFLPDPATDAAPGLQVPVISLDGVESGGGRRAEVVEEIREAAGAWGFFQIVNHGVPLSVMNGVLESVRRFNEQPSEVKKEFYSRDVSQRVKDVYVEYVGYTVKVRNMLSELLSEALGLDSDYLARLECMETQRLISHYHPPCPQPELTIGNTSHTDATFLTILLQDSIGGLQVLHQDKWVNVPPMEGAFVINLGDFMQLVTNEKYRSVEHRVLAKKVGPRISMACLLAPSRKNYNKIYGPIKEILSDSNPQLYRDITIPEFYEIYLSKRLYGDVALSHFKL